MKTSGVRPFAHPRPLLTEDAESILLWYGRCGRGQYPIVLTMYACSTVIREGMASFQDLNWRQMRALLPTRVSSL